MKKISLDTNRKFSFADREDVEAVFNQAKEIAEVHGYVTVTDICDLIGAPSNYMENMIGWSLEALNKAYISISIEPPYVLYFPQCDWSKDGYTKEAEDTETPSTGEPINITISSNEWDTRRNDIEQALNELFKNSDKIKDRPVFINIM